MSKKRLIDSIEVKSPCSENWDEMRGNEKVRFCAHCALEVNNISALTRKQAMRLVRQSNGKLCVRYIQNPIDKKPVFAGKLYQITRRSRLAAGVLGASLTLSTLTYAQGAPMLSKRNNTANVSAEKQLKEEKIRSATASISGTVIDENGAVIPGVTVVLSGEGIEQTRTTSDEGFYQFTDLTAGIYKLRITSPIFKSKEITDVKINDGDENTQNATLEASVLTGAVSVVVLEYQTNLNFAVSNNDAEMVKNLIANGDDVNETDENYEDITPLFLAVENGSTEIAELLLSYGAKVNYRSKSKQTPLMSLDEDASGELARLLIKYGAKINLTDENGNTALILAAQSANAEVLQILIDHDARINAQNKQGQTALMNAAEADNLENVRTLLMAGADVNLKNKEGETAFDLTTSAEIEELLKSFGAIVEDN
jgi:ankyrin repeat protein